MRRLSLRERDDWRDQAERLGFRFHTIAGEPYWDESAAYAFALDEIESGLEAPTAEIERMCFEVVSRASDDERLLARLGVPVAFHDLVRESWIRGDRNLYGRLDFSYGRDGPAKLLEYNADTPTALYESAVFQWVWLEQAVEQGIVPAGADQFNSLHERMIDAFKRLGIRGPLHLACCKGSDEDRGTVEYVAECAGQAGLDTRFVFMEDIGVTADGRFTDLDDVVIATLFKLYPWEWLMADDFGSHIPASGVRFIEPAWKAVLSNKGLLAVLWEMFEGHPNLLPAYFADDPRAAELAPPFVRKPMLSREGANVEVVGAEGGPIRTDGPYGAEGFVVQAYHPLPEFDGNFALVGSWLVASEPAGICIREDRSPVTTNASRFLPHVILD